MFNFESSSTTSTHWTKELNSKQYFKDNQKSGLYQDFDPITGELIEQGYFQNGQQSGKWRVIDEDGDQIHYLYKSYRVGALCYDGTKSSATGRGACSWHGGVEKWLYQSVKQKIGGTGKYAPIQQRIQELKKQVKERFKINKIGLQFQLAILNKILDLDDQKTALIEEIKQLSNELEDEKTVSMTREMQLKQLKTKLEQKQKKQKIEKQNAKLQKQKQLENALTSTTATKDQNVNRQLFEPVVKQKPLLTNQQQEKTKNLGTQIGKTIQKSQNKAAPIENLKPKSKQEEQQESDNDSERQGTWKKLAQELSEKMTL